MTGDAVVDVILYDGVCVLCSGFIRFVAARDGGHFRFVPLQSDYGHLLAQRFGIPADDPDTYSVVIGGKPAFRSDATLAILARLRCYGWTRIFRLVPRRLRDAVYNLIARNRYRWFGRHDACRLPDPGLAARVIERIPAA